MSNTEVMEEKLVRLGRPPAPEGSVDQSVKLKLSPEQVAWLKGLWNTRRQSQAAFLVEAIQKAMDAEASQQKIDEETEVRQAMALLKSIEFESARLNAILDKRQAEFRSRK